jgi:hypothetical protein
VLSAGLSARPWFRSGDRFGAVIHRSIVQALDHLAHSGRPVAAQHENCVERGPCAAVARNTRRVGHLVPRQVRGIPRRRITQDGSPHPCIGGERQVPQNLGKRPLTVGRLVQQFRRAHLGPLRIPPVELGLDQGRDVNTVDSQVLDLAAEIGVAQFGTAHHDAAEVNAAEAGIPEPDGDEFSAAEVGAFEPRRADRRQSGRSYGERK